MELKEFWDKLNRRIAEGESVDMHTARAAVMFGVEESVVTPEMRRAGKMQNFREVYTLLEDSSRDVREVIPGFAATPVALTGRPPTRLPERQTLPSGYKQHTALMVGESVSDYSRIEQRLLGSFSCAFLLDSGTFGFFPQLRPEPVGTARTEKLGRDGKPVKPEPFYRKEAKRGKRRY